MSVATLAARNGRNYLNQDVWWTDRDGITHLIDGLSDDHRRNIARMMIDRAAANHYRARRDQMVWPLLPGPYMPDDLGFDPEMSEQEIRDQIRREQAHGYHLRVVRESPLFRRMIRGLVWLHPGVL